MTTDRQSKRSGDDSAHGQPPPLPVPPDNLAGSQPPPLPVPLDESAHGQPPPLPLPPVVGRTPSGPPPLPPVIAPPSAGATGSDTLRQLAESARDGAHVLEEKARQLWGTISSNLNSAQLNNTGVKRAVSDVLASGISKSSSSAESSASPASRSVTINGVLLTEEQLLDLEQTHRLRIPNGEFWYDKISGAWGRKGGTCRGVIPAGLEIGGPLQADASGGKTGIFINGRQIGMVEFVLLRQAAIFKRGRYWLDAQSNFGLEGGPSQGNLREKAKQVALMATVTMTGIAATANRGGRSHGSVLSSWDRTGVAVYDLS